MNKKYDDKLVQLLKTKAEQTEYMGAPLLLKNLPDCDEKGAMDPRLYNDMKKQLRVLAWVPSKFMKMDVSEKGIAQHVTVKPDILSSKVSFFSIRH